MTKHKITRRFHQQVQWAFRKQCHANALAQRGLHDAIVVLDGLNPNHNIGKIFRSAEIFSIREIHVINTPLFNTAPAKGAFKRVPAIFYDQFSDSYEKLIAEDYEIYALSPNHRGLIHETTFASHSAFIVGHESHGLSFNLAQYPLVKPLAIAQFGQTESLNVAVAASICLYEYTRQQTVNHSS